MRINQWTEIKTQILEDAVNLPDRELDEVDRLLDELEKLLVVSA